MNPLNFLIPIFICIVGSQAQDCSLKPILRGVSVSQNLGATNKKIIPNCSDCKRACADLTEFTCTAILWPTEDGNGDCYLFDQVNLGQSLFVDDRPFILYLQVCPGQATPSVGYCEFILTQSNVNLSTSVDNVSPGATTKDSCHEFCISRYRNRDCNAYIVDADRTSTCTLYPTAPTDLQPGSQNLYTKDCRPPPTNCQYSQWTEWNSCSVSCGGGTRTRTREILSQASEDGVQCMDSEKSETGSCGIEACSASCIYSDWGSYSMCNATTCGGSGYKTRTRSVSQGDSSCDTPDQTQDTVTCTKTEGCDNGGENENNGSSSTNTCVYASWTEWGACSSSCQSTRSRTLVSGDPSTCEATNGPLTNSMLCEGGACNSGTGTDTGNNNSSTGTGNTGGGDDNASGCRIMNVDPSSDISSQGYRAVGAQQNCETRCNAETNFKCEAYLTSGPGTPCVLYGAIDRQIIVLPKSKYYLQDLNCVANKTTETGICTWQQAGTSSGPDFNNPDGYASIGLTVEAPQCASLCTMNHPIFLPGGCVAYAWNPNIDFTTGYDNCFMYSWDAVSNSSSGGDWQIWSLNCP